MKRIIILIFTALLLIAAAPDSTEKPEDHGAHQHVTVSKSENVVDEKEIQSMTLLQESESAKQSVTVSYESKSKPVANIVLWCIAPVCWMFAGAGCFYLGCRYKTMKGRGRRKK